MTTGTEVPASVREALKKEITTEVRAEYQQKYEDELESFRTKLAKSNAEYIEAEITKWREQQKPPSQEDIGKMLGQVYLEFEVKLPSPDPMKKTRTFMIRELPQVAEKKMYQHLKQKLIPLAKDMSALITQVGEPDSERALVSLLEAFEPMFDLLADVAVLALNPNGKDTQITLQWVQENLSSFRIGSIVTAQLEANRLRDFFSQLSRVSATMPRTAPGILS